MATGTDGPDIYVAITDTTHYSWFGLGSTPDEARNALLSAWYAHADLTAADPDYIGHDQINVISGRFGQGFRDYDAFPHHP